MKKINLSANSKKFIIENLGEEWLTPPSLGELLTEVDWLITTKGLTADQEWLNDFGGEAQIVYDDIYENN